MSTSPTPAAPADDVAHASRCEHCDDSVPHEHLDVRGLVEASRATALRRARLMGAVGGLALAVTLATSSLAHGVGTAALALAVTAAGWLAVTGAGLLVTTRAGAPAGRAVAAGALTSAGLTPLVALAVALTAGTWPAGLVAGAAWLVAGAVAAAFQARAWRALLLQPGQAGEHARATAVARRGATGSGEVRRWLLQGLLLGTATVLLTAVPVAAVVLVPAAVTLAAWSAAHRG